MKLQNKTAIITGAGSGIGKQIALSLAKNNANVVIAEWSKKNGQAVEKQIIKQGGQGFFIKTDVSNASQIKQMVQNTIKKFKTIDILVNNAGIVKFSPLHKTTEEDWDKILSINLKGVFLCSKAVLPTMLEKKQGKIINISSIAGLVGFKNTGAYCASKGGIIALTREMALEYAPKKININCIAPGIIKTAMTKQMLANKKQKQILQNSTPYPRLGEPQDIAQAVLYLASQDSNFVNGTVLTVDGGWISQ